MTLTDVEAIDRDFLIPSEIAGYLNIDPQKLRDQARKDPSKIGFPVIVIGTRVRIPKAAFIKYMRGEAV